MQKQSGQEVKRKSRGNCTFRRSKEKPTRSGSQRRSKENATRYGSQRKADRRVVAGLMVEQESQANDHQAAEVAVVHDTGDSSGDAGSVKGEVVEDRTTLHTVEG